MNDRPEDGMANYGVPTGDRPEDGMATFGNPRLDRSAAQAARECDGLPEPADPTWTDNTCSLMCNAAIHVADDLPELGAQLHHAADQLYTNARLIAASPALLEACREALTAARLDEWDGAGSIRHDAFQALVAAIAQAVGE